MTNYLYRDADADDTHAVVFTPMESGESAPPLVKARFTPDVPGVRGFGRDEAEALTDLFRTARDANRSG